MGEILFDLASFIVALLFLVGTFLLTAMVGALRRLMKKDSKKVLQAIGSFFPYRRFHLLVFPHHEYEGILFATICAQNIARVFLISSTTYFLEKLGIFEYPLGTLLPLLAAIIIFLFAFADFFPKILGNRFPASVLRLLAPLATPFFFISFPLIFLFAYLSKLISKSYFLDYLQEPISENKQEIFDLIQEADFGQSLNPHDRQILESVMSFQQRIAREVMVPRVDIFSLQAETTILEAAKKLEEEGYSRIPVYRNNVDNIVGVLMYKDVLSKYMEYQADQNNLKILEAPIESIMKNVIYSPETKKISNLLQEFRKKQLHLAIIVDEYGGTEGIVTIEDILEEIVGEIEDEYDDESDLFVQQLDGSYIVDARMGILDIEEQLGIKIPQQGDYDTLGGYIFDCAGTIPAKGFTIQHDDYQIEILKSNERCVEKVRMIQRVNAPHDN